MGRLESQEKGVQRPQSSPDPLGAVTAATPVSLLLPLLPKLLSLLLLLLSLLLPLSLRLLLSLLPRLFCDPAKSGWPVRTAVSSPPHAAPSSVPAKTAQGRMEPTASARSSAPSGVSAYRRWPSPRLPRRDPAGFKKSGSGGTGSGTGEANGSGQNGGSNTSTTAPTTGPCAHDDTRESVSCCAQARLGNQKGERTFV